MTQTAAQEQTPAEDWSAAMTEEARPEQSAIPRTPGNEATNLVPAPIFEQFSAGAKGTVNNDIDMILDIPVQLTVELGRTKIAIKNLLQLAQGSVVELETMAGEPMDVLINGYLIAQGEVVVVNDKFGIRLTDIVTPSERMRRLSKL